MVKRTTKAIVMAYKGPPKDFWHKVGHWGICRFSELRWFLHTKKFKRVPYSHVELNIDGVSYSASSRDGGVRKKHIDVYSGSWDLFEVQIDTGYALEWFEANEGRAYDWAGVFRFLFPFLPHGKYQFFCNEAVGHMLQLENPEDYTPYEFIAIIKKEMTR